MMFNDDLITNSKGKCQTTDTLLMVKPVAFEFNTETSDSNAFQVKGDELTIQELARAESDRYIALLRQNNINVIDVEDTKEPHTPDSVFPNNWFSTHEDGTLVLYPMEAENRRLERKPAALEAIKNNFEIKRLVDLTHYEKEDMFLEGTGAMVLDRVNKIAYACKSSRTSEEVLDDFCNQLGYTNVLFDAVDQHGEEIYHTNVMMNVGTEFAIVCLDAIADENQKKQLTESLEKTDKTIVEITLDQMNHFAGNMLEVKNREGDPVLIMSQSAHDSLTQDQIALLCSRLILLTPDVEIIEENGGGSVRCMIAEIF